MTEKTEHLEASRPGKLPYVAPALVSSDAFERMALGCNGAGPTFFCNDGGAGPKNCGMPASGCSAS